MSRLERGKMIVLLYVCRYSYHKAITVCLKHKLLWLRSQSTELNAFRVLVNCQAAPATSPLPKLLSTYCQERRSLSQLTWCLYCH